MMEVTWLLVKYDGSDMVAGHVCMSPCTGC